MPGHYHDTSHASANTGNKLGDRSSVRQSKLYRMYESGNEVKDLLGTGHLQWNTSKKQGVYNNHTLYDHNDPYNEVSATAGLVGLQEMNDRNERRTARNGQQYGNVSSPSKIISHEDKGYKAPGPLSSTSLSHTYNRKQTHREAKVKQRRRDLDKSGKDENFSHLASKTSPKYGHNNGGKKTTRYVKPPHVKRNVNMQYDTDDAASKNGTDRAYDDVYGPQGSMDTLSQDLDHMDNEQLERLTLGLRQLKDMAHQAEMAQRIEDERAQQDHVRASKIEELKNELAILQQIDKARNSPEREGRNRGGSGTLSPLPTARGGGGGEYGNAYGNGLLRGKKNTPSPNQGGRKLVPLRTSPNAPLLPSLDTSLAQTEYTHPSHSHTHSSHNGAVTSRIDKKREEHMDGGIINAMLRSPMRTYNNNDAYHNGHSPPQRDQDSSVGATRGILKNSPTRQRHVHPTNPEKISNINRLSPSHSSHNDSTGGKSRYAIKYDEYGNELQVIPSKIVEPPRDGAPRGGRGNRPGLDQSPLKTSRRIVADPRLKHPTRDPYATDASAFFRMDFDTPRNSHSHETYQMSPLHHPEMNRSHSNWKETNSTNNHNGSSTGANNGGIAMPGPLDVPMHPQYASQYATDSSAYFKSDFDMPDKSHSHKTYQQHNVGNVKESESSPYRNATDSSNYFNDNYSSPKESHSKSEYKPIPKQVLDLMPVSNNRPSELQRSTRPW